MPKPARWLEDSASSPVWQHVGVDADGFAFLLTPRGQRLLGAAMSAYDDTDVLALSERLRRTDRALAAEHVAAAITQAGLRRSAAAKFGADATRLYFTSAGLEQGTHPRVARHRTTRAGAGGARPLLDLGCGVGSDLMAFAAAGYAVTGVDSDGLTAAVAAANLAVLGLGGSVIEGTAQDADRAGFAAVFADPARRQGATRVFDPRAFSPSWDFVLSLLGPGPSVAGQPGQVVVKLGPGLDHDLVPPLVEAEWVSLDGDLKEVALWSPPPSRGTTRRRATLLTAAGGEASLTEADAPVGAPPISAVGDFVYEPDPAVIRAHLVSVVVGGVAGWLLDPHLAYVSSDRDVASPFARRFRVLEVLPFRERQLRPALRSRGIGALTIKKRGIAVTPEELRRRLALHGDQHATLILTRTPGSAAALLVEPLP